MRGAAALGTLLLLSCTRWGFVEPGSGAGDRGMAEATIGIDGRRGEAPPGDTRQSELSPPRDRGGQVTSEIGIPATAPYTRVEAGGYHNCALDSLGRLWCWGHNVNGQLGLGTTTQPPSTVPKQITAKTGFSVMSLGELFSSGLVPPGVLWTWGSNFSGELGLGDTKDRLVPTQLGGLVDWSKPSAGRWHACSLRNGVLWCWGRNDSAQLGLGDLEVGKPRVTPAQVGASNDWISVDAGGVHTCGIRLGGALFCWGTNDEGQVGTGTAGGPQQTAPVQIGSGSWSTVSLGKQHTCGIQTNGSLWCWGRNAEGQLGSSDPLASPSPLLVGGFSDWQQVASGWFFTCGIRKGGTLWCWGENLHGQIGNGLPGVNQRAPAQIPGTWNQAAGGMNHACGLQSDSSVWCWGENTYGQLGTGDTKSRSTPIRVTLP